MCGKQSAGCECRKTEYEFILSCFPGRFSNNVLATRSNYPSRLIALFKYVKSIFQVYLHRKLRFYNVSIG